MTDYSHLPYRPCVGITLYNKDKKVFIGERLDSPGSWQMPQGGIDEGEDIEKAFYRELKEEIGTDKAIITRMLDTPLRYDLPTYRVPKLWNGKYRGQEQTWIAAEFTGNDDDINIYAYKQPEFGAWQWIDVSNVLDLIVPFKKETYKEVIQSFKDLLIS